MTNMYIFVDDRFYWRYIYLTNLLFKLYIHL